MISIKNLSFGIILAVIAVIGSSTGSSAQPANPEVLESGSLQEQYEYVQTRTRIYEGFRAVREDMFQKLRRNSLDSLNQAKQTIQDYITKLEQTNQNMEALEDQLNETIEERDTALGEKESIYLLGIPMKKTFYNILLWSIIAGLLALAGIVYYLFKRSNRVTRQTKTEMHELQEEFDEYRKNSRERFEKQSIDHFNELRKLKGI